MDAGMLAPVVGMVDNAMGVMDNVATVADDVTGAAAHAVTASDNVASVAVASNAANPHNLSAGMFDDISIAADRVDEQMGRIDELIAQHGGGPLDPNTMSATKDARYGAHKIGLEAQARLEPYFAKGNTTEPFVLSRIQNADAGLEDAGWQLSKNPSPDGRLFPGDLDGARRDVQRALDALRDLVPAPA